MGREYLECGLPHWLEDDIRQYEELKDSTLWDCVYCELQSDINVAEVEQMITSEQAWYLREKYLGLRKEQKVKRLTGRAEEYNDPCTDIRKEI